MLTCSEMRLAALVRILSFALAFTVFWGTSGRAISSAFCQTNRCLPESKAAQPPPPLAAEHGCCSKKTQPVEAPEEPSSKKGCCCSVDTVKSVPASSMDLSPVFEWSLGLGAPVVQLVLPVYAASQPDCHYSGISPPLVAAYPDRGRAPPSA